jgi:hypothetical protein
MNTELGALNGKITVYKRHGKRLVNRMPIPARRHKSYLAAIAPYRFKPAGISTISGNIQRYKTSCRAVSIAFGNRRLASDKAFARLVNPAVHAGHAGGIALREFR